MLDILRSISINLFLRMKYILLFLWIFHNLIFFLKTGHLENYDVATLEIIFLSSLAFVVAAYVVFVVY